MEIVRKHFKYPRRRFLTWINEAIDAALAEMGERIFAHLHEDCILPDFDVLDLTGEEAPVNWLVLEELACRADQGCDPLVGMELVYATARATLPQYRREQRVRSQSTGA